MNNKIIIGLVLGSLGLGYISGRYLSPTKIETKIEVQEKVVEKIVKVKDESTKVHKTTVKLVTIKPDGTKTIETKIVDNSEIEITQKSATEIQTEIKTNTQTVTEYEVNNYFISVMAKTDLSNLGLPTYGAAASKRFIGPFSLGIFGFIDKTAGISVSVGF